jgi:hypothetical protein
MRREGREELELLGPKMDRHPVQPQLVGDEIELEAVGDG